MARVRGEGEGEVRLGARGYLPLTSKRSCISMQRARVRARVRMRVRV
jgi:hypothetical protein